MEILLQTIFGKRPILSPFLYFYSLTEKKRITGIILYDDKYHLKRVKSGKKSRPSGRNWYIVYTVQLYAIQNIETDYGSM